MTFRTHLWDPTIAELARRCQKSASRGRFVVLFDETHGPSPHLRQFEKFTFTADTSAYGLPARPVDNIPQWWNVDYGLYITLTHYPNFDYYVLTEQDVLFNLDFDDVLDQVSSRQLDLVAHDLRPADPTWYHLHQTSQVYSQPWQSFLPVTIVSRRAAQALFEERRRQGREGLANWQFCEGFVPSALHALGGYQMANLSEFSDVGGLVHRPHQIFEDFEVLPSNSLIHPVIGRHRYREIYGDTPVSDSAKV